MKIALWRILGNDLPGRHSPNQTADNLAFILSHEPFFADCDKFFLLNRIVDPHSHRTLSDLLSVSGHRVHELPFEPRILASRKPAEWIHYLTNVNAARNECLRRSADYDYVLPLDGGSFMRQDGWTAFRDGLKTSPPYVFLRQSRAVTYSDVWGEQDFDEESFVPDRGWIKAPREFTLAFSKRSDARFDESRLYGHVDKVELLWRLGFSNSVCDQWEPEVREKALLNRSRYFGQVPTAGFAIRLPSGNREADRDLQTRAQDRAAGLAALVEKAIQRVNAGGVVRPSAGQSEINR